MYSSIFRRRTDQEEEKPLFFQYNAFKYARFIDSGNLTSTL